MLFSEYITIFADAVGGLTQKTKHTMRCKPSTNTKLTLFIVLLLVIDQAVKFTVKLNMELYQSIPVFGNWFIIHFIENPGAAFGMQLGGTWGKLLLSLIRIAAIVLIAWYLHRLVKKSAPTGVLVGGALIHLMRPPHFFRKEGDTHRSCTAKWWICSISPSSTPPGPTGCR